MDDLSAKLKKLFKPKPKGVFKGKANVLGGPVTVRQLINMRRVQQSPLLGALKMFSCLCRLLNSRDLHRKLPQKSTDLIICGLKGPLRYRHSQHLPRLGWSLDSHSMCLSLNSQVGTRSFTDVSTQRLWMLQTFSGLGLFACEESCTCPPHCCTALFENLLSSCPGLNSTLPSNAPESTLTLDAEERQQLEQAIALLLSAQQVQRSSTPPLLNGIRRGYPISLSVCDLHKYTYVSHDIRRAPGRACHALQHGLLH